MSGQIELNCRPITCKVGCGNDVAIVVANDRLFVMFQRDVWEFLFHCPQLVNSIMARLGVRHSLAADVINHILSFFTFIHVSHVPSILPLPVDRELSFSRSGNGIFGSIVGCGVDNQNLFVLFSTTFRQPSILYTLDLGGTSRSWIPAETEFRAYQGTIVALHRSSLYIPGGVAYHLDSSDEGDCVTEVVVLRLKKHRILQRKRRVRFDSMDWERAD